MLRAFSNFERQVFMMAPFMQVHECLSVHLEGFGTMNRKKQKLPSLLYENLLPSNTFL